MIRSIAVAKQLMFPWHPLKYLNGT